MTSLSHDEVDNEWTAARTWIIFPQVSFATEKTMQDRKASIGLRAKTGRTIAVVLAGPSGSPQVLKRLELSLVNPRVPATYQPYHEVMELPWAEGQVAVRKFARAIEETASKALAKLIRSVQAEDYSVCGVGIVGAPERNLEKIGSPHIRAHAAEGVLFRHVLEVAAKENRLGRRVFAEHDFNQFAAAELESTAGELEALLGELGKPVGRPWRADEKKAAAAAWLALRSFGNSKRKTGIRRSK